MSCNCLKLIKGTSIKITHSTQSQMSTWPSSNLDFMLLDLQVTPILLYHPLTWQTSHFLAKSARKQPIKNKTNITKLSFITLCKRHSFIRLDSSCSTNDTSQSNVKNTMQHNRRLLFQKSTTYCCEPMRKKLRN